jgi:copper chaperone CopZ
MAAAGGPRQFMPARHTKIDHSEEGPTEMPHEVPNVPQNPTRRLLVMLGAGTILLIAAIAWVEAAHRPRELVIPVSDMTCEGCEASLKDKLTQLDGVIEVDPSRQDKEVRIVVDGWSGPERHAIEKTIRRAGYSVAE